MRLRYFLLSFSMIVSCANHGQLNFVTKLPKALKENSGIVSYENNSAWLIEDRGNKDYIYKVDFKGNILTTLDLKDAKNRDWEDLTKDKDGNLYIGDFGNNDNKRKDLVIYKLPNPETETGKKIEVEKITFSYPEQKEYPPKKKQRVYDAEAFFHHQGNLYIFTKNRADPFTGASHLYRVPDQKGNHKAKYLGKIIACTSWQTCRVTSADIAPDGKSIVLLGYGKLWRLTDYSSNDFAKATITEIDLGIRTQLEAVCFLDPQTLLLSDEASGSEGRNLYTFKL